MMMEILFLKYLKTGLNKLTSIKQNIKKNIIYLLKTMISFGKKRAKELLGLSLIQKIKDVKYSKEEVKIKWFYDGTLNASANCTDRHLKRNGKKTAIIWVGDDPTDHKRISYKELHKNVCKAANGLKNIGVKKGDRVTIYLTMIPELVYTMLACARIGAIHSIIFGGFSPDSIATESMTASQNFLLQQTKE